MTLRSLEAKLARLMAVVNLSRDTSRLVFPRASPDDLGPRVQLDHTAIDHTLRLEADAGYMVPSGKYWKEEARFDPAVIDRIDATWLSVLA